MWKKLSDSRLAGYLVAVVGVAAATALLTEYLRVFIGQLRKKIEPNPASPRYILTEPWDWLQIQSRRLELSWLVERKL